MAAGVLWQAIQLRPCHRELVHLAWSVRHCAGGFGLACRRPPRFVFGSLGSPRRPGSWLSCLADPTINWRRNDMEFPFDQQKVHHFITSMDIAVWKCRPWAAIFPQGGRLVFRVNQSCEWFEIGRPWCQVSRPLWTRDGEGECLEQSGSLGISGWGSLGSRFRIC